MSSLNNNKKKSADTIKIEVKEVEASLLDENKVLFIDPYKFELTRLVGKGAFGNVYANDKYALKLIRVNSTDNDNDMRRKESLFCREVEAFKRMENTPDFLRCHKYGKITDNNLIKQLDASAVAIYFIVMDVAEHSLHEWIKELRTEDDVLVLFRQICARMLDMHEKGLEHRDIKPSNIMYNDTPDGRAVNLIDFGQTKVGDDYSCLQGTWHFLPPELEVFNRNPTAANNGTLGKFSLADIWSLGMVLLDILLAVDKKGNVHSVLPVYFYKDIRRWIGGLCKELDVRFPRCAALLGRMLRREDDGRMTWDELGQCTELGLNREGIICGHYKYDSTKRLGSGGFGSVFEGTDINTKKPVAVKRICCANNVHSNVSGDIIERYTKEEIKVLKRVRDLPNALQYLASQRVEEVVHETPTVYYYIVTELCKGSLDEFFNRSTTSKDVCKDVLRQLCAGLMRINREKDVIHRDISPKNIMFCEASGAVTVKIIDFGLAKDVYLANTRCGTETYMAPEAGKPGIPQDKVDLYSLGKTLEHYVDKWPALFKSLNLTALIKDLTEKDYGKRASWSVVAETLGIDTEETRWANARRLIDYADDLFYESARQPPYALYAFYTAAYRLIDQKTLVSFRDSELLERCAAKIREIGSLYKADDPAECKCISVERFLVDEAIAIAKDAVAQPSQEKKKDLLEKALWLLYDGYYDDEISKNDAKDLESRIKKELEKISKI